MRRVDIVTWKQEVHCRRTKSTECALRIISSTDGTSENRALPRARSTVRRRRWPERSSVSTGSRCTASTLRKGLRIRIGSSGRVVRRVATTTTVSNAYQRLSPVFSDKYRCIWLGSWYFALVRYVWQDIVVGHGIPTAGGGEPMRSYRRRSGDLVFPFFRFTYI